jgi:outer membrane protein
MSIYKNFAGAVLLAALFAFPSCAQTAVPGQATRELSLAQAIEIAISPQGNTGVQLAHESLKLAQSRYVSARSVLLPDVETSVAEQDQLVNLRALGIDFPLAPGFAIPHQVGPFNTFDARVRLNQSILNLPAIRHLQAARQDVRATEREGASERDRVAAAVAKQYAAALRTQASVEVAKADIALAEVLRDLAMNRESVGEGDEIEVSRAKLTVARDQQRLLAAQTEDTRAHLDLINLLNLDWNTALVLTGNLGDTQAETPAPEQALDVAFKSRTEFQSQARRSERARLGYSAAKLERMPSLVGYADYGDLSGVATHTAYVALRLPLFDGGRLESDRAEALTQVRQERIRETDLRNQVELEVRKGLATLASAKSQVQVAEMSVSLAEDELARARRRYESGVTNSIEVVDAETRLENARDDRIAARFNYTTARVDLAYAMGTIETISF